MGFSRQEYWSGLPFLSPGDLRNPGIKPGSPTLQADALLSEPAGEPWKDPGKVFSGADVKRGWYPLSQTDMMRLLPKCFSLSKPDPGHSKPLNAGWGNRESWGPCRWFTLSWRHLIITWKVSGWGEVYSEDSSIRTWSEDPERDLMFSWGGFPVLPFRVLFELIDRNTGVQDSIRYK